MSGAQALVRSLTSEGVEVIFGLPGVQLDLVFDALYHERATLGDIRLLSGPTRRSRQPGDPDLVRKAAELLRRAERPVIYSGGGTLAASAWDELHSVAEQLEAPVVMSVDGRGALSDRHDLAHTG